MFQQAFDKLKSNNDMRQQSIRSISNNRVMRSGDYTLVMGNDVIYKYRLNIGRFGKDTVSPFVDVLDFRRDNESCIDMWNRYHDDMKCIGYVSGYMIIGDVLSITSRLIKVLESFRFETELWKLITTKPDEDLVMLLDQYMRCNVLRDHNPRLWNAHVNDIKYKIYRSKSGRSKTYLEQQGRFRDIYMVLSHYSSCDEDEVDNIFLQQASEVILEQEDEYTNYINDMVQSVATLLY